MNIEHGMRYKEFVATAYQALNIPQVNLTFRFTLDLVLLALISLNKDNDLKKLER